MNANYYTNNNDPNNDLNHRIYYKIAQQNDYPSQEMLNIKNNNERNNVLISNFLFFYNV